VEVGFMACFIASGSIALTVVSSKMTLQWNEGPLFAPIQAI
jgi:hypothetical protein